jgi:hypothetical protein
MGESWVAVRDGATQGTLRASDPRAREVSARWDQFIDYLALSLSQDLGRDVAPVRERKSTQASRCDVYVKEMATAGTLSGSIRVPDAVGPIRIVADLRTKRITTSINLKAPGVGRPQTKINWALKQLRNAPMDVRIDVQFAKTRETSSLLRSEATEDPARLLFFNDPKRDPRSFDFALSRKMGLKRGIDAGSFSRETRRQTVVFYRDVVQDLKTWQAPAPKLDIEAEMDEATQTAVTEIVRPLVPQPPISLVPVAAELELRDGS